MKTGGGLDAATEVLTRHGWRRGIDLRVDDKIATFDGRTYRFDRVGAVSVRDYEGPLVHLRGASLDCRLVPGHPVLLRVAGAPGGWRSREAGKVPRNFRVPGVGPLNERGISGLSNDLLEVMGWVINSGSYHSRGSSRVLGFQCSTGKAKRGQSLVEKMDRCVSHFEGAKRYERKARPVINYYLGPALSQRLLAYLEGNLRRIPRPVLEEGSPRQLSILFEALMDMSGWSRGDRWSTFSAGRREGIADDFQELATRLGIGTTKTLVESIRCWVISISRRKEHGIRQRRQAVGETHYKGQVWEVWVPSGAILIRSNGRLCVVRGGPLDALDLGRRPPIKARDRRSRRQKKREAAPSSLGVGTVRLRGKPRS